MFQSLRHSLNLLLVLLTLLGIIGNINIEKARADTMVLSQTEIEQKIQNLSGWTTNGQEITRTFKFKDFVSAIEFVNQLVEPAELAGHHPDLAISYNKVTVNLTTHDAGGITQKDFDLAKEISKLAQ